MVPALSIRRLTDQGWFVQRDNQTYALSRVIAAVRQIKWVVLALVALGLIGFTLDADNAVGGGSFRGSGEFLTDCTLKASGATRLTESTGTFVLVGTCFGTWARVGGNLAECSDMGAEMIGIIGGVETRIVVGPETGLPAPASPCEIECADAGGSLDCACLVDGCTTRLFTCTGLDRGNDGTFDDGNCVSCNADPVRWVTQSPVSPADTAVLVLNPAFHPDNTIVLCDLANPSLISVTVQDPQIEFILSPAISRLAEILGTSAGPDSLVDSSSGSSFNYAALAGGLAAAAAVAVAVGGWYARRRWLR